MLGHDQTPVEFAATVRHRWRAGHVVANDLPDGWKAPGSTFKANRRRLRAPIATATTGPETSTVHRIEPATTRPLTLKVFRMRSRGLASAVADDHRSAQRGCEEAGRHDGRSLTRDPSPRMRQWDTRHGLCAVGHSVPASLRGETDSLSGRSGPEGSSRGLGPFGRGPIHEATLGQMKRQGGVET